MKTCYCAQVLEMLVGAVMFLFFSRAGASGLRLSIEPERAHISENTNLTVMCRAREPLAGCHFKHGSRPVIDLSRGHRTPSTDDYKYFGNGLKQGECGVELNAQHLVNDSFHFVDCRVKTLRGGWLYQAMEVFVTNLSPVNILAMPPREVLVIPGGNASVFVKTEGALTKCKFRIPSLGWVDFSKDLYSTGRGVYQYLGRGLPAGECGITLLKVAPALDGLGFVSIDTNTHDLEIFFIRFIFAKAPGPPVLEVTPGDREVTATCSVTGRPWANISWFIGEEVIRRDEENEALDEGNWKPPRRQQTLRWRVREGDVGKTLSCVASHSALGKPLQASAVISVLPPSLRLSIEPERAHISENTNLTVMCRAREPLAGCHFKHGSRPVIDLSHGHRTASTDDYKYFGNGLQQGECGVVLNAHHLVNETFHSVECRARTETGGWVYRSMDVYVTEFLPINILTMPPRELVFRPGDNVSLLVTAEVPITKCKLLFNSIGRLDFTTNTASNATAKYRYHGDGLQSGDCGVTLLNVTEDLEGVGFVSIRTLILNQEIFFVNFTVAKAPGPPMLEVTPGDREVAATCSVNGRPWANISWFIGEELVRRDEENEALDEGNWKPSRRQQTLRWRVREGDVGRTLRCVASHPLLDKTLEAGAVITLKESTPLPELTTNKATTSGSTRVGTTPGPTRGTTTPGPTRGTTTPGPTRGTTTTSSTTTRPSGKVDQQKHLSEKDDAKMNISLVIGVVAGLLMACLIAFVIYAWYTSTCCFSHPSTRVVRHGQIGMSKLLENDEPMESVTASSYVGTDA